MTIRINQIAVDFTLERETSVADLTTSLRAWAAGQNLAILGILTDGRALGPDDPTPLSGVGTVEIEAVPAGERDLARVAVVARYFALLSQATAHGDTVLVAELEREYPSVRQAVFPLLDVLAPRLAPALDTLDQPWSNLTSLAPAAALVARETEERRRELQDPDRALGDTLSALESGKRGLVDLGLLFQRGQDKDGFERILGLFTLLEDLGRRAGLALQGRSEGGAWTEFHDDLRPFLRETEQALASGDYILLTDLLEYEVIPRLSGLPALFPWISVLDPVPDLL